MAQLIQSNALSPIQGSAGQFSPVVNQGPTLAEGISSVTKTVGGLIDTAGNIYGQNRAESLVEEEIENIDRARKIAEEGEFTAGDAVPESLKLDQKEWDMLSTAVQSGTMSREKARLIAGSRLRSRIAEEPFFADRMRKAASGVLGFNIESEGARQYFASFPTEGQLGEGGNAVLEGYAEQADAWVALGLIEDRQEGMKYQAKLDMLENENEIATLQAEAGVRSANDLANTFIRNKHSAGWGRLIGGIRAEEAETGQPVRPETFTRNLKQDKATVIEEFDKKWIKAGGDLNSEDYNRHMARINDQYSQMEEFVTEFGVDNVMKIKLERQEQMFDALGMEMFPQLTMITRTFGQQVTSDLINMSTMNPTKRDMLMAQNPELKSAFQLMNSDPKEFNKSLFGVASKIVNGEQLTDEDTAFIDPVVTDMHQNGSKETKEATIQGLFESNLEWKGLSLLSESSPRVEPEANIESYKTLYDDIEPLLNNLASEVAKNDNLTWDVNEDGEFVVGQDSAAGAMATPAPGGLIQNPQEVQGRIVAYQRAQQLADKLNEFAKGHKRGWSRVVGENLDQYKARIKKQFESQYNSQMNTNISSIQNDVLGYLEAGDIDAARDSYQLLQNSYGSQFNVPFDNFLENARQGGQ